MTTDNKPLDLDAISGRAEAATAGPWRTSPYVPHGVFVDEPVRGHITAAGPSALGTPADAVFIASARTDVPALVAEVKRLHERVRELEACTPAALEARMNAAAKTLTDRYMGHGWLHSVGVDSVGRTLVVYAIHGRSRNLVPEVIDGFRTRYEVLGRICM